MGLRRLIQLMVVGAMLYFAPLPALGSMSDAPVVTVDPVFQFEPAKQVNYRIQLPRAHNDVMACWGWVRYYSVRLRNGTLEDRDDGRRSCMTLHGEHDSKFHYPVYRNLQWGEYVAFLEIYGQGDKLDSPRLRTTAGFNILKQVDD